MGLYFLYIIPYLHLLFNPVKKYSMKRKNSILIDLLMILVSIYFTIDYYLLIMSGDDLVRRKIALVVWIFAIIGWSIKLFLNLKKKNTSSI